MIQKFIFIAIFSLIMLNVSAQVTIGAGEEPARAALLDLKNRKPDSENVTSESGGLILSRVKLSNRKTLDPFIKSANDPEWNNASPDVVKKLKDAHAGLMVYNLYVSATGETNEDIIFERGIYVWDGVQWNMTKGGGLNGKETQFFYMPPINIPLSSNPALPLKCDLYKEYADQFTASANSSYVSNNPALTEIPKYTRAELDFVITSYDNSVIEITKIENDVAAEKGTLYYKALSPTPPAGSFITIVFVIK